MSSKKSNTVSGINLDNLISLDEKRVKEIFDHDYQNKFIKIILSDDRADFFHSIYDIIVPEYFDDYQRQLIDKTLKYFQKYSKIPDYNDLKREVRLQEKNELHKDHLVGLIDKIEGDLDVRSSESIKETALTFFKKRALANALYKMATLWDKDNFDAMSNPLTEALKAGEKKDDSIDYLKDIDKTLEDDVRRAIPIMDGIDEEIEGGLAGGELAVVMAPTGGGKSMVLVAMAANTIKKGYKVLYVSLELDSKYVARRFHSCFSGIPLKELRYFPDVIKENAEEIFGKGGIQNSSLLKIKRFNTRSLTVSSLRAYLEGLKRNENFVPDIICLDYADIMNSSAYEKDYRLALQLLYQDLRGLSGEVDIPILTASQSNRQSNKEKLLTIENIAESYAKVAETDLVLGIGRGETGEKDEYGKPITLKQLHKATVGFLKNRMGSDGFYKMADFDTRNVQISIIQDEEGGEKTTNESKKVVKKVEKNADISINSILERENMLS
jgi:archaellum biogenesis ATPase FlaH